MASAKVSSVYTNHGAQVQATATTRLDARGRAVVGSDQPESSVRCECTRRGGRELEDASMVRVGGLACRRVAGRSAGAGFEPRWICDDQIRMRKLCRPQVILEDIDRHHAVRAVRVGASPCRHLGVSLDEGHALGTIVETSCSHQTEDATTGAEVDHVPCAHVLDEVAEYEVFRAEAVAPPGLQKWRGSAEDRRRHSGSLRGSGAACQSVVPSTRSSSRLSGT